MSTSLERARTWRPDSGDVLGQYKRAFLDFLISNCLGYKNVMPEDVIVAKMRSRAIRTKSQLQHQIIVPFRERKDFFIGTSSKGIYLVNDADDAEMTMDFYTTRIRSEHKHLRNLRSIVKRDTLFHSRRKVRTGNSKSVIYFDESGVPSLANADIDPFFIVSAVIIDNKKDYKRLGKRLVSIRHELGKPDDFEFKSVNLNKREYEYTLRELSNIDYSFASVCFVKKKLSGEGFKHPKSFYKYAFQFLVDRVLDFVVETDLFFDEYSDKESSFKSEFLNYLKLQNIGFPAKKIHRLDTVPSGSDHGVQLADLISGIIKNKSKKKYDLLPLIDEKMIAVFYFPLN